MAQKKPKGASVANSNRSFTLSKNTSRIINKIAKRPAYRNNRSMAVESLIVNSPEFKEVSKTSENKK